MGAREYAVVAVVGVITLCLLVGLFGYLLFTSPWDFPETASFSFVPVVFGCFGIRAAVIVWRRRSRRMRVA